MKSLKFTILILSFLAVSAAVSGCAWRLGRKPVNPPVTENENQPSENPKSEIKNQKSEIINTDDWLTYRNEEYGFEVKYPEGWSINGMLLQNQTDRNQEIFLEVYNVPIYWTTILGGYGRMKTYETSITQTESVHRFSRPAGRKDFQAVQ